MRKSQQAVSLVLGLYALDPRLFELVKANEGYCASPYLDTAGLTTIGYGWCIDRRPTTRDEAALILATQLNDTIELLIEYCPWFETLDPVRQAVLVDMAFNLGLKGLLSFRRTLISIRDGRYADAARQMLESKWASQVKTRSQRLSRMMLTGEWQNV